MPPGELDQETLRAALPYDNEIVVADLPRETYAQLVTFARSRPGTDAFAWIAERDIPRPATVTVATTDYLATVAPGYRDFFKGTDLKKIIKTDGALPIGRALKLAIQISSGIGFAHRSGLVHADVKPQNILVTREDIVKVTDFGIAQALTTFKRLRERHERQQASEISALKRRTTKASAALDDA